MKDQVLLELDRSAGICKLLLHLLGIVLGDGFLDGLGSAIDEVLCFLESETGEFTNDLDDVDLVGACSGENDIE